MPRPLPDITQKIEYAAAPSLDDIEDDFEEDVSTQTGPTGLQPGAKQYSLFLRR